MVNVGAHTVALGAFQAGNLYKAASGNAWDAPNAASWTAFDPGATASPATQASGALAVFADGGSTGTGANTVTLNNTRNIQGILLSSTNAGHNYTINDAGSGTGLIILDNTGNGVPATITDSSASGNSNAVNVPITLNSNLALSVTNAANTLTLSGTIGESAVGSTLTKTGAGTAILAGANTYTGATSITGGTLQVGNGSTGSLSTSGTVSTGASGTLAVNLANGGTFANAVTNGGAINAIASGSNIFTGAISGGSFNQNGIGTSVISTAVHGFAPTTVSVNSGTLLTGAANVSGTTTGVTLNSGVLAISGHSQGSASQVAAGVPNGATSVQGFGALTLSQNSTLDFNSLAGTVVFGSFNPNGATLTVNNYTNADFNSSTNTSGVEGTDSRLVFNIAGGLTSGQLSEINFTGFGAAQQIQLDGNFYEVGATAAVPEPTTIFAGILLVAFIGIRERRRMNALYRRVSKTS